MKAPFSAYLAGIAPGLKELAALLRKKYDYVSVLSTDSTGFQVSISQRAKSVTRDTLCTERGTVVRVCRNGLYAEYAFTGFDPEKVIETGDRIVRELDAQLAVLQACGVKPYETGILPDEPLGIPSDQPSRWMMLGAAMAIQENGTESLDYFAMLRDWELARSDVGKT